MQQFRNYVAADEEGQRSIERRGLFGHLWTGVYRIMARSLMLRWYVAQARLKHYIWDHSEVALLVEKLPQRYINPVLKAVGASIADECVIGEGIRLMQVRENGFAPFQVGHKAWFARQVMVDLTAEVVFGDRTGIGNRSMFITQTDLGHSPMIPDLYPITVKPIYVGRGAFVGPGSIVLNGVTIGECAVIGANSVVIQDIPPYTLAAGSPARVIRPLDRSKIQPFAPNETEVIPKGTTPEAYAKIHPDYDMSQIMK